MSTERLSDEEIQYLKERAECNRLPTWMDRDGECVLLPDLVRALLAEVQASRQREQRFTAVLQKLSRPAHAYASENADRYRGFDDGVRAVRDAWNREYYPWWKPTNSEASEPQGKRRRSSGGVRRRSL